MTTNSPNPGMPEHVLRAIQEHQAKEAERIARYGHVRPPITSDFAGYKLVAVGSKLTWAKTWKTFPDFLMDYIRWVFGEDWGNVEIKKPFEERHPVLQWYHKLCEFQRARHAPNAEGISEAIATGPVMAYLWLAYDLYTLEHHALLQEKLIRRLKMPQQFQGARYEVSVAAMFVRAGFDVVLEDETDSETSHCEFTATHKVTGAAYSVEAKSRHRDGYLGRSGTPRPLSEIRADVYALLQRALRKRADHERIVFVDLNIPPDDLAPLRVVEQVKRLEETDGPPYPAAFLFFTNHPYHYVDNEQPEPGRQTMFIGINIPSFHGNDPNTLDQYLTHERPAVLALYDSVIRHVEIPRSFH